MHPIPKKYGYSCQSECSRTNGKLVLCGIYPRRTLIRTQVLLYMDHYFCGWTGKQADKQLRIFDCCQSEGPCFEMTIHSNILVMYYVLPF